MSRRLTRPEMVINHLTLRGHISEGSSLLEYGRFRLGDAIFRLRTSKRGLVPEGMEIVTIHKQDTQGNPYGEYHLVSERSAEVRQRITDQRAASDAAL